MPSLEKRVVRMPCRFVDTLPGGIEIACIGGKLSLDGQGHLPHAACQGTGLLWYTLSREHDYCFGTGWACAKKRKTPWERVKYLRRLRSYLRCDAGKGAVAYRSTRLV